MKSVAELYTGEMRKKYGKVHAAWKLGNHYELGDYGILKDKVFTYLGNVKQMGIDFQIFKDPTPSDEIYKSTGVSSNKIAADGKIVTGKADVATGFRIEFSNAYTVFYEALNVRTNRIGDTAKLGTQILDLYKSGLPGKNGVKWEKNYVVITELDIADSATIIISNSKNAKIELHASTDINMMKLSVADPKLSWGSTSEYGLESKLIANAGATPLFKLMGVCRKIFGSTVIGPKATSDNDIPLPTPEQKTEAVLNETLKFIKIEDTDIWTGEQSD